MQHNAHFRPNLRRTRSMASTAALALAAWMANAAFTNTAHAAEDTDPIVRQILADISPQRIERRIRALVAFETRHTQSETESDKRGIGAARRWIERELRECSRASGGALRVEMQSHIEPAGRRLTPATELVNVVAPLPGASAAAVRERNLVGRGPQHLRPRALNQAPRRGRAGCRAGTG